MKHLLFVAVVLMALMVGGIQSPVESASTVTLASACGFAPSISSIDVIIFGGEGGAYTITNPDMRDALEEATGVTPGNVNGAAMAYMTVQPANVTFAVYLYPNSALPYRVACENGTVIRTNAPFFRCWAAGECHLL